MILELKEVFSEHPLYNKIVPFIENRYAFTERPQFGIVVKGSSANKVVLSADNFLGSMNSHVMLGYVGAPVHPIEWVREDELRIRQNGGILPTPPGVYYLEILKAPENAQDEGCFVLDPLITITDEPVLSFTTGAETEGQLQQIPVSGTLRLWENNRFLLVEGEHYALDSETGKISFLQNANPGATVTASYRYALESSGPYSYQWNKADFTTLPGVVLAFGKRGKVGDKVAIVVYEDRVETAHIYGGRMDVSFDIDIIARDTIQAEEIADLVFMYLYVQRRPILASEGIEVVDVTFGGESEEVTDEAGEEFTYMVSMSCSSNPNGNKPYRCL